MEFRKCKTNAKLLSAGKWRLTSVDEVRSNMGTIEENQILESWDIVRLLDGWVDGPCYRYTTKNEYRHNMGHMLMVKMNVSRPSDGRLDEEIYSGEMMNWQGRNAAVLLYCGDKITEVMCFVLKTTMDNNDVYDTLDSLTKRLMETLHHRRTDFSSLCSGHINLFTFLMRECDMEAKERDRNGENPLHFVVNNGKAHIVYILLELTAVKNLIYLTDSHGRTPLHKVAAIGNVDTICILMEDMDTGRTEEYIGQADLFGQTTLLEAARGVHKEVVEYQLSKGSRSLLERKGRSQGSRGVPIE
ncbi:hypothetical protein SUGI_0363360 [Cryptomeria japonica]|nr:hypothetical protein SUGI_0363360 [Cryptomeria japonica]